MPAHLQTLLLALAVGAVYGWLQTPALSYYSLQAFAVCVTLYFGLKRVKNAKRWHLAPAAQSFEMVLISFALLLIVGATGNLKSVFFPLTYVHLFLLVFSTDIKTSIPISFLIAGFHYALGGTEFSAMLAAVVTIPLLVAFFIFAKYQYDEVQKEKRIIEGEEKVLAKSLEERRQLAHLVQNFIQPKLIQLREMSLYINQNRDAVVGQILILQMEISKFMRKNLEEEP